MIRLIYFRENLLIPIGLLILSWILITAYGFVDNRYDPAYLKFPFFDIFIDLCYIIIHHYPALFPSFPLPPPNPLTSLYLPFPILPPPSPLPLPLPYLLHTVYTQPANNNFYICMLE